MTTSTAACSLLPFNLSPNPSYTCDVMSLVECFEEVPLLCRSFVIWYDKQLQFLNCPLHVYYSAREYAERYNPNRALVKLTQDVDVLLRRPWYGSVVVAKFGSRACTGYIDLVPDDIVHIRDYFAYFA